MNPVAKRVPNVDGANFAISRPINIRSALRSPVAPAAPARKPFAIFPAVIPRSPSPATESNSSNFFELFSSATATFSTESVNALMPE